MDRSKERNVTFYRYDDEGFLLECANCGIQFDYERRAEIYDEWEFCPGCGLKISTVGDDGSEPPEDDWRFDAYRDEPWVYMRRSEEMVERALDWGDDGEDR